MGSSVREKIEIDFIAMSLTGNLWPAHIKPQPDELLSSWIVRLAMAHAMKLHTFCSLVWSREKQIWNRDIDKCADDSIIQLISDRTGTSRQRVFETCLEAYAGRVYEKHNSRGNTLWLMPVGIYHRTRTLYGLQFCGQCLAEDKAPYYRRAWRLAFMTVCEKHQTLLHDRCPKCEAPINFHRNEMGDRNKWAPESVCSCHLCHYDLRASPTVPINISNRVIEFQRKLTLAAERGWISVPQHGAIHSHLYFTGLHQLMRTFAPGGRTSALRDIAALEFKLEVQRPQKISIGRDVERLSVQDRHTSIAICDCLLSDWPNQFVRFCHEHKVWSASLLRDLDQAPYWYWRVVHDDLYRVAYTPSDVEIHSAISHLKKTETVIKKKVISRTLGKGDVFRKRKSAPKFNRLLKTVNRQSRNKRLLPHPAPMNNP